MKHVIFPSNNFQYVGADISPFLINQNRKKYPNLTFYVADIVDGSEFLNIKMKNDNVSDLIFIRHLS
jgi:ubiquinone/menaquinone biosynthesis C-methylase UbiE